MKYIVNILSGNLSYIAHNCTYLFTLITAHSDYKLYNQVFRRIAMFFHRFIV